MRGVCLLASLCCGPGVLTDVPIPVTLQNIGALDFYTGRTISNKVWPLLVKLVFIAIIYTIEVK